MRCGGHPTGLAPANAPVGVLFQYPCCGQWVEIVRDLWYGRRGQYSGRAEVRLSKRRAHRLVKRGAVVVTERHWLPKVAQVPPGRYPKVDDGGTP